MWELDYKESWVPKNWCFWTVVLEKTLESPLDSKDIQPVHPKGNQSWIFIGRTDAEAETPILWPPEVKSWLIWKDPDAGKIEGKRRRGWQKMRWLDSITDSMDMTLSKLWQTVKDRGAWRAAVHRAAKSQTWLSNWATRTKRFHGILLAHYVYFIFYPGFGITVIKLFKKKYHTKQADKNGSVHQDKKLNYRCKMELFYQEGRHWI